jgi:hypothetical protein
VVCGCLLMIRCLGCEGGHLHHHGHWP